MVKLTEEDKELLRSWHEKEEYFPQIQQAMMGKYTVVTHVDKGTGERKRITHEKAIELLGRRAYLSGIHRSAFHRSAVQGEEATGYVYFDSGNLFKKGA